MPGNRGRPRVRSTGPAPPTGRGEEIADRRARALEEPLDVRRLPGWFVRLEVRNPIHGTHYTVILPTFPSRDAAICTCTDFSRSGLGTCKHVEAAVRWMGAHPDQAADPDPQLQEPAPSWTEIDERIRSVPAGASLLQRMNWAGAGLTEALPIKKGEKEGVGHRGGRGPKA